MNELQVEQITILAQRLGLEGVIELCQDWAKLKEENEQLKVTQSQQIPKKIMVVVAVLPPAPPQLIAAYPYTEDGYFDLIRVLSFGHLLMITDMHVLPKNLKEMPGPI